MSYKGQVPNQEEDYLQTKKILYLSNGRKALV